MSNLIVRLEGDSVKLFLTHVDKRPRTLLAVGPLDAIEDVFAIAKNRVIRERRLDLYNTISDNPWPADAWNPQAATGAALDELYKIPVQPYVPMRDCCLALVTEPHDTECPLA